MSEFSDKWGAMSKSDRRKVKHDMQGAMKSAGKSKGSAKKMTGEAHSYDSNRPARPVVSRYAK